LGSGEEPEHRFVAVAFVNRPKLPGGDETMPERAVLIQVYGDVVHIGSLHGGDLLNLSLRRCYPVGRSVLIMQAERPTGLTVFGPEGDEKYEVTVRHHHGRLLCILHITSAEVVVHRFDDADGQVVIENADRRRSVSVVEFEPEQ